MELGPINKTMERFHAEITNENEVYITSLQALALGGLLMNGILGDTMISNAIISYKLFEAHANRKMPIIELNTNSEVNGELYNSEIEKQKRYLEEIRVENKVYVDLLENMINHVKVKEEKERNWGIYGGIFSYFLLKRQLIHDLRKPSSN